MPERSKTTETGKILSIIGLILLGLSSIINLYFPEIRFLGVLTLIFGTIISVIGTILMAIFAVK